MVELQAPAELKTELTAIGTLVQRPAGAFLFRRGDAGKGIFLIAAGAVRLGLEEEPPVFPSRKIKPGAVLGLPATLSDSPYRLSAQAVDDSVFVHLSRENLLGLLRDQHHLCFHVMRILTEELAETRMALERVKKVGV
ncbi:MAG TPA: Crp/Fnr family transcriptional regulator [Terriglobales bacterium]|nr:Crp/Fnr family transcriptional regulator [Terriglobales bacterium]